MTDKQNRDNWPESDIFETEEEAMERAEALGCEGAHTVEDENGVISWMPCESEDAYVETADPMDTMGTGGETGVPTGGRRSDDATPETREIKGEIRVQTESGRPRKLVGYAAVFNSRYQVGQFDEQVAPGAFTRSLQEEADVRALVNHDPARVLGRTKSNTLRLSEDDTGLRFEIDLPDTQDARDIAELVKRGDMDQASFGFVSRTDSWSNDSEGRSVRELQDLDLFDVSIVAYPANDRTQVSARRKESCSCKTEPEATEPTPEASTETLRMRLSLIEKQ